MPIESLAAARFDNGKLTSYVGPPIPVVFVSVAWRMADYMLFDVTDEVGALLGRELTAGQVQDVARQRGARIVPVLG